MKNAKLKIQKTYKCIIISIYILENFYKNICTCIKSPAIDCQAFEDRPVDRDRLVGHPCSTGFHTFPERLGGAVGVSTA